MNQTVTTEEKLKLPMPPWVARGVAIASFMLGIGALACIAIGVKAVPALILLAMFSGTTSVAMSTIWLHGDAHAFSVGVFLSYVFLGLSVVFMATTAAVMYLDVVYATYMTVMIMETRWSVPPSSEEITNRSAYRPFRVILMTYPLGLLYLATIGLAIKLDAGMVVAVVVGLVSGAFTLWLIIRIISGYAKAVGLESFVETRGVE